MADIRKVILLLETSRVTGRELLGGIAQYSRLHGPWSFYSEPGETRPYLPQMKNWKADGIIANVEDSKLAKQILDSGIPAVTKVMKIPGIPHFAADEMEIAAMAADYFLGLGLKHFAYFGIKGEHWSEKRGENFETQMASHGIELHTYNLSPVSKKCSWHQERLSAVKWLKSLPYPIGIFAANDFSGRYVIETCKETGIQIPDEAAILGVDDDTLFCELCEPPLSSISLSLRQAGFEAAKILADLMNGKKVTDEERLIKPLRITKRASTDILTIEDQDLVTAIRFIRSNASRQIFVADVLNAVGVSRRVLEKRFKKTLNKSILEEIRHARVEKIIYFLTETNYPIGQIAYELGFPGVDHIARYFKLEMGMSPHAYRKERGRK